MSKDKSYFFNLNFKVKFLKACNECKFKVKKYTQLENKSYVCRIKIDNYEK